MYVCICVCMYVGIDVCAYECMCMYVGIDVGAYECMCMYVGIDVCAYECMCMYVYLCSNCSLLQIHARMCTCIYMHVHVLYVAFDRANVF